jgi:aryl-alcohol dehydrogenase-like predicted oxidoreductase
MGMSYAYGPADDAESLRVLRRSLELGCNFWDTAELYGPFKNEELIGRALKEVGRDRVIVATKFAMKFGPGGEMLGLDSSPGHLKKAVEGSLKRLGTSHIDLLYQHRLDPATPIEETVGAMADLVREGKVRYLGLSEVGPAILKRAHAVHPLSALQSEYSLWERNVEAEVLPTLRELGIGFVPYSPLGRGFLTGQIKRIEDLEAGDYRRNSPRFQGENLRKNLDLVDAIHAIAADKGCAPSQLALAWVLAQGTDIVPIPGTKRRKYLEENVRALEVKLTAEELARIDRVIPSGAAAGERYAPQALRAVNR